MQNSETHALEQHKGILKPFYFIVVLWGEKFRNYFIDYCLPSLLAPDNIPALHNKKNNKFLICTVPEDWHLLQQNLTFKELATFIEPVFIEIPLPNPWVSGCQHMGIGHKLATEICYKNKAYGVAITPDLLISNGTIANIQKQALLGKQVVYCAALRFEEESLFQGLSSLNLYSPLENRYQFVKPLMLSGRELVKISVPAFHSQVLTYDFDTPYFAPHSPAVFFRIPEDGGVLLHSLSWCPLLLDYGIVKEHKTESLETWTMDGDYVYKNFFHAEQIYICTDSDDMMLVSWAPSSYKPEKLTPDFFRRHFKKLRQWINGVMVRSTLEYPLYDEMKIHIFPTPVRWHIKDVTPTWDKVEKDVQKIIFKWKRKDGKIFNFIYQIYKKIKRALLYIEEYLAVIIKALLGNQKSRRQILRRIRIIAFQLKTIFGV